MHHIHIHTHTHTTDITSRNPRLLSLQITHTHTCIKLCESLLFACLVSQYMIYYTYTHIHTPLI